VVYVSATGATTINGLAYATRLGLWSGGTMPFADRETFCEEMVAGGVAALEVVGRDLKSLGLYQARALSYDHPRQHPQGVRADQDRQQEDDRAELGRPGRGLLRVRGDEGPLLQPPADRHEDADGAGPAHKGRREADSDGAAAEVVPRNADQIAHQVGHGFGRCWNRGGRGFRTECHASASARSAPTAADSALDGWGFSPLGQIGPVQPAAEANGRLGRMEARRGIRGHAPGSAMRSIACPNRYS